MKKKSNIIIYLIVFYNYINLIVFYIIYTLLYIDYGKKPNDNILVTKSYYYKYFQIIRYVDKYDYFVFLVGLFLIGLRLFKINLINNTQIKIFFIGIILSVLLILIDPFGAFNWYLD